MSLLEYGFLCEISFSLHFRPFLAAGVWASLHLQWQTDKGEYNNIQFYEFFCEFDISFYLLRLQRVSCSMLWCSSSLAGVLSLPCRRRWRYHTDIDFALRDLMSDWLIWFSHVYHNDRARWQSCFVRYSPIFFNWDVMWRRYNIRVVSHLTLNFFLLPV